ncbi:hypothetical protein FJ365_04140 [Candidatus Dependentiae bacterium]|nr:hypothetical protein [Candidatus Dependentiae bacterium]
MFDKPEAQAQKNMYRILLGLQVLYSGLKLGYADFDSLPSRIHIPHPHRSSYWKGTAGWTFSTTKWDYDPYAKFLNQRYNAGGRYLQEDYFGRNACTFPTGTPEYDFWFNTIRPKYQAPPPPISIATVPHALRSSISPQRDPIDMCGICYEDFADNIRKGNQNVLCAISLQEHAPRMLLEPKLILQTTQ